MKEVLLSILLGIVQGLTEFLPVSSSGHLNLFQDIFGMSENVLFTTVALHFGTLLAVVVYYFRDLISLFKKENHHIIWKIIIATIPAGLIMLVLHDKIESVFSTNFICFGFLATAIILLVADFVGKKMKNTKPIGYKTALVMGVAQSIAILPGISRSGSTITGGLLARGERNSVARFSFFMSIPIIAGSAIFEIATVDFANINIIATIAGVITAFLSGLFAIKVMIKLIGKCNFKWFSLYLLVMAVVTFVHSYIVPIW